MQDILTRAYRQKDHKALYPFPRALAARAAMAAWDSRFLRFCAQLGVCITGHNILAKPGRSRVSFNINQTVRAFDLAKNEDVQHQAPL
jgi:hypothetical protein